MDKSSAIRQINGAADWWFKNRLNKSSNLQEYFRDELEEFFLEDNVAKYQLQEYVNGFYLGEIQDNERHGYGIYLWNESHPNSIYLGEWQHGDKNGKGVSLQASGICYQGGFVNGKYQGERSYVVRDDIEFIADFHNDDIRKVHYSNCSFTYNGRSYGNNGNNNGSNSGCIGFLVVIAIVFGLFKFCGNCSGSSSQTRTEVHAATTTYVCTARKSLKVRSAPNTAAQQLGSLMGGEEIEVYEIVDGFAKVRYNGNIGYASIKYLKQK